MLNEQQDGRESFEPSSITGNKIPNISFHDLKPVDQVRFSEVIMYIEQKLNDDGKIVGRVKEYLKNESEIPLYYEIGEEYPSASRYPRFNEMTPTGQIIFFTGVHAGLPSRFNNPVEVPKDQGWSPYATLVILARFGLKPFIYQPSTMDDWGGSTNTKKFGDGSLANSITYRAIGTEEIASRLKIELNAYYEQDNVFELLSQLEVMANDVTVNAMDIELPQEIAEAIRKPTDAKFEDGQYCIEVELYDFRNKNAGFTLDIQFYHIRAHKLYTEGIMQSLE